MTGRRFVNLADHHLVAYRRRDETRTGGGGSHHGRGAVPIFGLARGLPPEAPHITARIPTPRHRDTARAAATRPLGPR
jgi:hypothetical protein